MNRAGTVEALSAGLGRGSEFVVRLPISEPPSNEPVNTQTDSGVVNAEAVRVLVVDDNKDAANSISMLLRATGCDVKVAYSGEAAIETAIAFKPEAVFLDIGMPEMDGYEVARQLRRNPKLKHVRLAALTGYGHESDRRQSHEAGFDAHMVKPVEPGVLREFLNKTGSQK